jgi:hypothetical protein
MMTTAPTTTTASAALTESERGGARPGLARTAYWVSTAIIALLMTAGGLAMLFWPPNRQLLEGLGFPGWFAGELGLAKLLGVAALLVPGVPARVKEWAYAGFAVILVSAALAHLHHGDGVARSCEPLGFLVVLLASNACWRRP